jgi:hypothetical protein
VSAAIKGRTIDERPQRASTPPHDPERDHPRRGRPGRGFAHDGVAGHQRETTVKSETKALVDAAIRDLNYAPNPAARSLAGSAPFRIGLLYDNPSTGYLSEFLVGALDESSRTGAQVVIEKCAEPELAGATLTRC